MKYFVKNIIIIGLLFWKIKSLVRAFTLGIVNGIYKEILVSKHKITPLPGLVLVKSFTIVLQWTSTYTSDYSPIVNLNFIFFLLSYLSIYLYILREFKKLVIVFFLVKNTPKLINQQLKNMVKIVNWQKRVRYYFFYCQKYPSLKLKNGIKIVN